MKIHFETLQELSHDLVNYLNKGSTRFSPRPYNFQKKDHTLWWLVPSQKWPAYQFGKIALYVENNNLNIGLNVEKGFAPIVGLGYPRALKKQLVMDDNWQWNTFINDVNSGEFDDFLLQQLEIIDEPFQLTLSAGIATDPDDYDPESPRSDKIVFNFSKEGMTLKEDKTGNILDNLSRSNSVKDLLLKVNAIDDIPWIWCDLSIIRQYERSQTANDCLMVKDLVQMLNPFMKWVIV